MEWIVSELKKIIAEGEGVSLDFKFRIDDQKKIARTLVAFANTEGGKLLIGVKDNGKVAGADPEEEFYMIQGASELFTRPIVEVTSKVWQEGHHLVLEVDVPKSDEKHKAKDEDGQWKFYHRVEDQTLLANKIVFKLWRMQSDGMERPEIFSDEEIAFIKVIEESQPVTISKLYRTTELNKNAVNSLLATLIHWGVVQRKVEGSRVLYALGE